jgi:hypothetical protein
VRFIGPAPLDATSLELDGESAAASRHDGGCAGAVLVARERCQVRVAYLPPASGAPRGARFVIHRNFPGDASHVVLEGSGPPAADLAVAADASCGPSADGRRCAP